jgi:hypothetical protein
MKTPTPLKLTIPIFTVAICGYLLTLNSALFRNDSPETIVGCVTLGVTHPPGYPLFNLMGKCFNVFAVGNPAFTYNFMASLLAAIGACLLCINLWTFFSKTEALNSFKSSFPTIKYFACFIASLSFAFSNGYWGNAIAAKGGIYIFQIILELVFLLFFQVAVFKEKITLSDFYFLFFLMLLGGVNHWPSQILLLPAIFLLFVFQARSFTKKNHLLKTTITCLTFSLIVFSLYLYLPLRAHLYPILNFDAPYTCDRFIKSVLRSDYTKTEIMSPNHTFFLMELSQKSIYISQHLFDEFNFSAYIFMATGVFYLNKVNKKITLFFLILLLTVIMTNLFYLQVTPIEFWHMDDHLLSSNWIFGMLIGTGIYTSLTLLVQFKRPTFKQVPQITLLMICFSLIPFTFIQNFSDNNQKNAFLYYGYGLAALKSMPKNTLYFAESDYDSFSTLYLKTVLNKRPDIHLLMTLFTDKPYERELISKTDPTLLTFTQDKTNNSFLFDLIQNNYKSHPIYCTFANVGFSDLYLKNFKEMKLAPSGILTHVIEQKKIKAKESLYEPLKSFWEEYLEPEVENPSRNQGLLRQACASPYLNAALYEKLHGHLEHWDWYYSKAVNLISEPSWLAQTWFERAEGDALSGNNLEAQKSYQIAACYFAQLNQIQNAEIALSKAKALSLKSENQSKIKKPSSSFEELGSY